MAYAASASRDTLALFDKQMEKNKVTRSVILNHYQHSQPLPIGYRSCIAPPYSSGTRTGLGEPLASPFFPLARDFSSPPQKLNCSSLKLESFSPPFNMAKGPVKYFVVDAFTDSAFKGNPAAVCLLEEERDEEWLQSLAAEFNISVACYLTRIIDPDSATPRFRLRWFTPVAEVKLCGHASLASAHTLFTTGLVNSDIIEFDTLSGILTAKMVADVKATDASSKIQNGGAHESFVIELNFPVVPTSEFNSAEVSAISEALNGASLIDIRRTTTADDLFVVLPSGKHVMELQPQFDAIKKCPGRGVIVSGIAPPESGFDYFSRFFCPKYGVNEDPVCGSAHCSLTPYWSQKLGKCDFITYAASPRGGIVNIHLDEQNQRVLL